MCLTIFWSIHSSHNRWCWCSELILRELKSVLMETFSFILAEKHAHWSRQWNRSIRKYSSEKRMGNISCLYSLLIIHHNITQRNNKHSNRKKFQQNVFHHLDSSHLYSSHKRQNAQHKNKQLPGSLAFEIIDYSTSLRYLSLFGKIICTLLGVWNDLEFHKKSIHD